MREPRSAVLPVPADVDDILLWRLAVDVAAAHQPGHDSRCTSLLCADKPAYPCPPTTAARRAAYAARRRSPEAAPAVPPAAVTSRAALIAAGAGRWARRPAYRPTSATCWPPPLRRPTARRAA